MTRQEIVAKLREIAENQPPEDDRKIILEAANMIDSMDEMIRDALPPELL
jgi:hypothetical protein